MFLLTCCNAGMRTPTNTLLVAMAVSDTMTGISPIPGYLYSVARVDTSSYRNLPSCIWTESCSGTHRKADDLPVTILGSRTSPRLSVLLHVGCLRRLGAVSLVFSLLLSRRTSPNHLSYGFRLADRCSRCTEVYKVRLTFLSKPELGMGPFLLTQSNPIHEVMNPIHSNRIWIFITYIKYNKIHKYVVLNRTRKLCAARYRNVDF